MLKRLVTTLDHFESLSPSRTFAYDPKLGFLTLCPGLIGTGLKARATLAFDRVNEATVRATCNEFDLDAKRVSWILLRAQCVEAVLSTVFT